MPSSLVSGEFDRSLGAVAIYSKLNKNHPILS